MENFTLTFGSLGGAPPERFLIFRDGDVGIAGLEGVMMDSASAAEIIGRFKEQGSELVIDYHHMSGKVEKGEAAKAPAAGWIRSLEYVKGEGLFAASIEWTSAATDEISAGEFQYVSPSFYSDADSGSILGLHSVALTNRPRTTNAWKLIAAELTGEPDMATKKKTKVEKIDAAEGDVLPAVPAEMSVLAKLIDKLGLPDDTSLEEVLMAALSAVAGEDAPAADAPVADAPASENAEMIKLRAKAANAELMAKRLGKIEAELKTKRVGELVEGYIAKGVINPNNAEQLEAAKALANSDEKQFEAVFGSMPAICEPGSIVNADGGKMKSKNSRAGVIEAAKVEYSNDDLARQCGTLTGHVNACLQLAELPGLNKSESTNMKEAS